MKSEIWIVSNDQLRERKFRQGFLKSNMFDIQTIFLLTDIEILVIDLPLLTSFLKAKPNHRLLSTSLLYHGQIITLGKNIL